MCVHSPASFAERTPKRAGGCGSSFLYDPPRNLGSFRGSKQPLTPPCVQSPKSSKQRPRIVESLTNSSNSLVWIGSAISDSDQNGLAADVPAYRHLSRTNELPLRAERTSQSSLHSLVSVAAASKALFLPLVLFCKSHRGGRSRFNKTPTTGQRSAASGQFFLSPA